MTTDRPSATATPTGGDLLASIVDLCEAYARAETTRALAEHANNKDERDNLIAHASAWNLEARTRYDALTTTVEDALPRNAQVEKFLPVRTLPDGRVEIHALDQHARPVVLTLTGPEAVTVGVHLTAHAAIGLDRTGTRVDRVLPPMITAPVPATTAETLPDGQAAPVRGVATVPPVGHAQTT